MLSISSYTTASGGNNTQAILLPTPCLLVRVDMATRVNSTTDSDTWVAQMREANDNQWTDDDVTTMLAFRFGIVDVPVGSVSTVCFSYVDQFIVGRFYPAGSRTLYGLVQCGTGAIEARFTLWFEKT